MGIGFKKRKKKVECTGKEEISKAEFVAAAKVHKAIFCHTPGLKERTVDSSRESTLTCTSAVFHSRTSSDSLTT